MVSARVLALAVIAASVGTPAAAQHALDRKVGLDPTGRPVQLSAVTAQEIGALAHAAGVPMGLEALVAPTRPGPPLALTGLRLGDAIAAILALDPRYEATEDDGVVVFRPAGATPSNTPWMDSSALRLEPSTPLDLPTPAISLPETTGRDALALVATLLGAPSTDDVAFSDTKSFTLDAPAGTVLTLLNAVVRAHGTLAWVFGPAVERKPLFPYTLLFMSGVHGTGLGVVGRAPPTVGLGRWVQKAGRSSTVLDIVVGPTRNARPLLLSGLGSWPIWELVTITHVPMGIEISTEPPPARGAHEPVEFMATGRTLREVLETLTSRDPRYEWREMDGVIVVRPVAAWSDPDNPLFQIVPDVEVANRTMTGALREVLPALGAADLTHFTFPDSRRVSLAAYRATALDLVNAVVRAHGSLSWVYQPSEGAEARATGLAHHLTFYVAGGTGLGVPVR